VNSKGLVFESVTVIPAPRKQMQYLGTGVNGESGGQRVLRPEGGLISIEPTENEGGCSGRNTWTDAF